MSGWRRISLRDVIKVRSEITHPRDLPKGAARFVGLEHIEPNTGRRIGELAIRLEELTGRKARFHPGDIVYGYLRPYLNKVWLADFDGYCSVDQYVFQVNNNLADREFVALFLRSEAFLNQAPVEAGPGQLPRIRIDEILDVPFTCPPIPEQRRVAAQVTAQLAAAEIAGGAALKRIAASISLRTRAYDSAFRSIVPLSTSAQSTSPPSSWAWRTLTDLARLETGHTPSRSRPDWWQGDIPWISLPDVRNLDGRVALDTAETTNPQGIANSSARVLPTDTVVMSRTASVGFVTRMGRPMATSQDFVNWVCGPKLDPEFLVHLLIQSREYIRSLSSGAIHKTVYMPTIKMFLVCVPPIGEQGRIAAELRGQLATIDAMAASIRAQRAAIEALRRALLSRTFTDLVA